MLAKRNLKDTVDINDVITPIIVYVDATQDDQYNFDILAPPGTDRWLSYRSALISQYLLYGQPIYQNNS